MFVAIARQTVTAEGVRLSTADASNIVNVVTTTIRASIKNAVRDLGDARSRGRDRPADGADVISYTDAGPSFETPLQLRYSVINGQMIEERWQPDASCTATPSSPPSRRRRPVVACWATSSSTPSDEPLFRYYNADGYRTRPGLQRALAS